MNPSRPTVLRRGARTALAVVGFAVTLIAGAIEHVRVGDSRHGTLTAPKEKTHMWMTVETTRFAVTLDDNATSRAFVQLLPATLEMAELNGNEKHARLPRSLPTAGERPGTIRAGDVLLYGDDTLVVFYETFRSSYAYTRIGHIEDPVGLSAALGTGSRRVSFSKA